MSAETLRRAAALMRERAEAATNTTPLPWFAVDGAVYAGTAAPHQVIAPCLTYYDDAEHIASWHPAAALAVADWLDDEADACISRLSGLTFAPREHALSVARAYLGSDA